MAKRGVYRRLPGEEPYFPAPEGRPYRSQVVWRELPPIDVAQLRKRLGLSQREFAHRFSLALPTLRHWEQGRYRPEGCALALLHVIDFNSMIASRALMKARAAWLGQRPVA